MIDEVITPTFHPRSVDRSCAQQSTMSPTEPDHKKSLSRSLGEFFGHIWKGVQEPVDAPAEKQILRQETTEQVRETASGKVIVRRTVVEELEIPTPPPKK